MKTENRDPKLETRKLKPESPSSQFEKPESREASATATRKPKPYGGLVGVTPPRVCLPFGSARTGPGKLLLKVASFGEGEELTNTYRLLLDSA